MKSKFKEKLSLKKKTISNLMASQMRKLKGGDLWDTYWESMCVPGGYTCGPCTLDCTIMCTYPCTYYPCHAETIP